MKCVLALCFVLASADLRDQFEELLRNWTQAAAGKGYAVAAQIGWSSASEHFTVAAGPAGVGGRPATSKDTFLFGSGTKPLTAAAVLRLVEQGRIQATDSVAAIVDPYLRRHQEKTLAELFGAGVEAASVLDVIRMTAGFPDFEVGDFDDRMLNAGGFQPVYANLRYAAAFQKNATGKALLCAPKSCSAYSSAGFEVAGLILAAVLEPQGSYSDMDLGEVLPNRSRYSSFAFPPVTSPTVEVESLRLFQNLSLPGYAAMYGAPKEIFQQNPSILGWTCGNLVASAGDLARFWYDLMDQNSPSPVLGPAMRGEMLRMQPLTQGWAKGAPYGAGVMLNTVSPASPDPKSFFFGHGGITYGFASSSGYWAASSAGFSVVVNVDVGTVFTLTVACHMMQLAAAWEHKESSLNCSEQEEVLGTLEREGARRGVQTYWA
ncbi:unnamed protein product [Effrenium voratum]|uniref:Beta-lactamase-related domain-containing protein n=1 Tax=Effrenium voratum TaxID=2562239 RepID=A0AA36IGM1_9DINO|nr:unnamed protein product [Effrenium voratum]